MVEAGTYNAKVSKVLDEDGTQVACVFGESENKGTPFVGVEFVLSSRVGDASEAANEFTGQLLPWRGYFSGEATTRVVESLVACGFEGDDIDAYPAQSPDRTVQVVVEHQEWEGETQARIAWVNGPRKVKKLDSNGLKTLGASLKSVIAAAKAGAVADESAPAEKPAGKSKKKAPF